VLLWTIFFVDVTGLSVDMIGSRGLSGIVVSSSGGLVVFFVLRTGFKVDLSAVVVSIGMLGNVVDSTSSVVGS